MAFNSHLQRSFSGIPVEVGGIELEWLMFKASIAEPAAEGCGLKVIGASSGGNLQTSRWTPVVKEADRLKKESFRYMFSQGTWEAAARYRQAWRMAALAVTEAKERVCEELGEAMKKDYLSAPKCFWTTIRHLRRRKWGTI